MRTLINRLEAEGVFDRASVQILSGAFDDAWATLLSSRAPFADERDRERAREMLAQHIIGMARLGERDKFKLSQSALAELASKLK
jgi:hypothetical protein